VGLIWRDSDLKCKAEFLEAGDRVSCKGKEEIQGAPNRAKYKLVLARGAIENRDFVRR
jgi:hypothetical protein